MDLIAPLLLQVVLILLNALFSCAEIAVLSVNPARVEKLAQGSDRRAKTLAKLIGTPTRFLSTIQISVTLAGFLGSAFAADHFASRIVEALRSGVLYRWLGEETLHTLSVIVTTLILSFFTLIFGELLPKRLAMRKSEKIALAMAGFLRGASVLFTPIVSLLTVTTNGILRLMRINPDESDEEVTEEGIRLMVDAGSESGAIEEDEKELIQNVFDFNDITAGEISTHRTEMVVLWRADDAAVWQKTITENAYTYYPVCGETIDDIRGILDSRLYFRLSDKSRGTVNKYAIHPAYFVPASMAADDLLRNMQSRAERVAIVVDEFGGTHGILTINDLLSRIVGDLGGADDAPKIVRIGEDTYRVPGQTEIEKLEELIGLEFDTDSATAGGWATEQFGSLPRRGDSFTYRNLQVHVSAANGRRVLELTVHILPQGEDEEPVSD